MKCGGKTPELSGQWDTDQECTAFTGRTIGLDAPFVGVNHGLDITQPQAKTFTLWIFPVWAIELFKNTGKGFIHPNPIIFYLDPQLITMN